MIGRWVVRLMAVASPSTRWSILLTVFCCTRGMTYGRDGRGLKIVSPVGLLVYGAPVEALRIGGVVGGALVGALVEGFLVGGVVVS